ncbi:hypothetical protein [Clostridium lundense]|nr:hypothetical protein [Clostridium lundense]
MKIFNEFINKLTYRTELEDDVDTLNSDFENRLKETIEFKMMLENTIIM